MVDNPVRRKMEDMLRTWKDPVPGSMDTRPVFSHELVRPIENALMRARAATMPQSAMAGRGRGAMMPHRNTPTPPGMRGYPQNGGPAQYQGQPPVRASCFHGMQSFAYNVQANYYAQHGQPQGPHQPPAAPGHPGAVGTDVDKLNQDIQNLIVATQAEFSQNPHDGSIQTRLKALMDLQGVLQRSTLPPDQLELIKNKVTELASVTRPPTAPSYTGQNMLPTRPSSSQFQQASQPAATPAAPGQMSLDALLGQGALAALMARTGSNSNNTTPVAPGSGAIRSPPPAPAQLPPAAVPTSNDTSSLLERLRQAGMLPPAAATPPPPVVQAIPPPAPLIPANIASILSAARAGAFGNLTPASGHLSEAMLKQQ